MPFRQALPRNKRGNEPQEPPHHLAGFLLDLNAQARVSCAAQTSQAFMETLTAPQVFALAPDPASAKAGQGLANPAKWSALGRDDRSVWGECQGSALYRTQADLNGPAFHCSCPSRKFPCKHGLGLLLVLANHSAHVSAGAAPGWVEEWIKRRDAGAEKKAGRPVTAASDDPAAAIKQEGEKRKRSAQREARVQAGLAELQTWLGDLVRQGFAKAKDQPARFYDTVAARMVDAQAPGLTRRLREWPGLLASGEQWADRLLEEAGALQWLLNGAARLDGLPAGLRASVRAAIGWTTSEQELLADPQSERCTDRWQIVGQRIEEEDTLRVQRTWLVGEKTRRSALCLSFAAGGRPLDVSLLPGTALAAELVFYPSASPLRASVGARQDTRRTFTEPAACDGFEEAAERTATWLAGDPWLERVPWFVRDCIPCQHEGRWCLRDASGAVVPLSRRLLSPWPLIALSGGAAVTVFGEWDGQTLLPLSVVAEGRFVNLGDQAR